MTRRDLVSALSVASLLLAGAARAEAPGAVRAGVTVTGTSECGSQLSLSWEGPLRRTDQGFEILSYQQPRLAIAAETCRDEERVTSRTTFRTAQGLSLSGGLMVDPEDGFVRFTLTVDRIGADVELRMSEGWQRSTERCSFTVSTFDDPPFSLSAKDIEDGLERKFEIENTDMVCASGYSYRAKVAVYNECEALRTACERLKAWEGCALAALSGLSGRTTEALSGLELEYLGRTQGDPSLEPTWHPLYFPLRTQIEALRRRLVELPADTMSRLAEAHAECARLPGPGDKRECDRASKLTERTRRETRAWLERELALKIKEFLANAGPAGSSWTTFAPLAGQLQTEGVDLPRTCPPTPPP